MNDCGRSSITSRVIQYCFYFINELLFCEFVVVLSENVDYYFVDFLIDELLVFVVAQYLYGVWHYFADVFWFLHIFQISGDQIGLLCEYFADVANNALQSLLNINFLNSN